ncbi:SusC/RagA family TonB-linked outer membrane protein [Capnocytophaga canis]|uniref:SusC/RagA family TonB-linked outer membrane protein n=1 Tax=Capnocytophaga canis TaxID=1848903 RepID=UPI001AC071ED|nr:TonB-dependent receptor [Capnocytophaga canis]GIM61723.1 SusC/RagA family TonB-linked outer membrane protein [Capnocytophaga canis]
MTKKFLLAVLLMLSAITLTAQVKVTGKVTDETSSPLPGANVILKGTMKGVVTDFDGNYTLEANQGDIIEFSYIGYQSQTKNVIADGSKSLIINISLREDAEKLEDVVVVGYGVQKKVNLTGAVSSVKGETLETRPVANATQSLQGMVSGLFVNNSGSGRPGANGSLSLRGQGNLSNTANPYVLVDGVEMNLADVNPNDIENISVLKDAAASAIYGARAAYGVILVTTKKGQEDKMRINYQGTMGFHSPTVLPDMVDSYSFAQYWNAGVKNAGSTRLYSDQKMALLQQYITDPNSVNPWFELPANSLMNPAFENSERGVGNVDYFDLHYKNNAVRINHNLSVSGGNKKAQYYLSGGYYEEDGILRYAKMDFKRHTLTANISSQMTDWLKIKLNTKFLSSQNNTPFGDGGLSEGFYHSLARFRPTVSHIDPNGNFTELTMIPYLQSGTYTTLDRNSLNITAGAELQPLKNWFIFFDYTHRQGNDEYEALSVAPNIYAADGVTTSKGVRSELSVTPDGRFTRYYAREGYKTMNLYTNYLLTLAEKNNFTFMAGYQEEDLSYSYLKNSTTKLYSTTNPNVGMGAGDKVITDSRYGWATRGIFGRINYDYDGRYLLEINGRYDGSSRFAKANRWGFFPSLSMGWNISRESFMETTSNFLSNLKLRASYGLLGNQAGADLYTFAATMPLSNRLGGYIFSDGRHSYTQAPKVIDLNTTWEKVESKNIGIDFGLFDNKLTGSFDVFQRDTKDMLGTALSFPDFFGADAPKTNNANMRNKGWELQINYRGKITEDISFNVGGMLSDATSVVTKYTNPEGTAPANSWYEGRSVGEIWGYRSSGLIQTQAEADEYNKTYDMSYLSPKAWTPGDVKYIDLNNDKKIDRGDNKLSNMGDMTIIGNTTPRYQYTINGGISWKGLALNVMLQGVGKRDWHPESGSYFWGSGPYAQVHVFKQHLDYWSETNPNAYYPKPYIHTAGGVRTFQSKNKAVSDRYLQNAAYCRLKNVTLSYTLSEEIIKRFNFQKVQMFISGENLLTFTSLMDIYDPEAIFTGNTYTGEGGKNYPMNKVVSMGIIVNF